MSDDLSHDAAIDAICGCAVTVTLLSYQEAIEGYLTCRGISDFAALKPSSGLREALEGAILGIESGRLYEAMCCSGADCGCRGSSNADLLVHDLRSALAARRVESAS